MRSRISTVIQSAEEIRNRAKYLKLIYDLFGIAIMTHDQYWPWPSMTNRSFSLFQLFPQQNNKIDHFSQAKKKKKNISLLTSNENN